MFFQIAESVSHIFIDYIDVFVVFFSGFEIKTEHRKYIFKPVSVQTLW